MAGKARGFWGFNFWPQQSLAAHCDANSSQVLAKGERTLENRHLANHPHPYQETIVFGDEPPSPKEIRKRLTTLIPDARQSDASLRRAAVEGIYELCRDAGPLASAAIDTLIECLSDPDEKIGESASYALHYCAPDSLESLIGCLQHSSPLVRERACHSLGNIGDDAIAAAPALRLLLNDEAVAVRAKAAWALGLMHDVNGESIAALFAMTASEMAQVRGSALHALGNIGKALASPAILQDKLRLVEEALQDESEDVRRSACYLLESMGLEDSRYIDLLMERLDVDTSTWVQNTVASDLEKLASEVDLERHMPRLVRALRRGNSDAADICELLASRGPAARGAIDALQESLQSSNDRIAIGAAVALWRIDGQIAPALPRLAALMEDNPESVCDAICQIGPAALPLLPAVLKTMEMDDWDCKWAATDALAALASSAPESIDALTKALGHDSHIVKPAAVKALAQIGEPAVAALIGLLEDETDSRVEWAADTLGRIGHAAMPAADLLRARIKSSKKSVAIWSSFALAKISGDPELVPMLLKSIKDDDAYLRQESVNSLAAIRPLPKKAVAAINKALGDEDEEVRSAAEAALQRINTPLH